MDKSKLGFKVDDTGALTNLDLEVQVSVKQGQGYETKRVVAVKAVHGGSFSLDDLRNKVRAMLSDVRDEALDAVLALKDRMDEADEAK